MIPPTRHLLVRARLIDGPLAGALEFAGLNDDGEVARELWRIIPGQTAVRAVYRLCGRDGATYLFRFDEFTELASFELDMLQQLVPAEFEEDGDDD